MFVCLEDVSNVLGKSLLWPSQTGTSGRGKSHDHLSLTLHTHHSHYTHTTHTTHTPPTSHHAYTHTTHTTHTHHSHTTHTSHHVYTHTTHTTHTHTHRAEMLLNQYRLKSKLYRSNIVLAPLGDDFRWDTQREIDNQFNNYFKLIDYINTHPEMRANVQFGTLADYFEAVRGTAPPDGRNSMIPSGLPMLTGDFFTYADRWVCEFVWVCMVPLSVLFNQVQVFSVLLLLHSSLHLFQYHIASLFCEGKLSF